MGCDVYWFQFGTTYWACQNPFRWHLAWNHSVLLGILMSEMKIHDYIRLTDVGETCYPSIFMHVYWCLQPLKWKWMYAEMVSVSSCLSTAALCNCPIEDPHCPCNTSDLLYAFLRGLYGCTLTQIPTQIICSLSKPIPCHCTVVRAGRLNINECEHDHVVGDWAYMECIYSLRFFYKYCPCIC